MLMLTHIIANANDIFMIVFILFYFCIMNICLYSFIC